MTRPSPAEAVAAAVHDLRTGIGSIRLALTSLIDDDDDPEYRRTMLAGADDEVRRLNARLTALPALVAAGCDRSRPQPQSLTSVLRTAIEEAARRQVIVTLERPPRLRVEGKPTLAALLAAVLVVAGDGSSGVTLSVRRKASTAVLAIARSDGEAVSATPTFVERLAMTAGAASAMADGVLEFSLPLSTRP